MIRDYMAVPDGVTSVAFSFYRDWERTTVHITDQGLYDRVLDLGEAHHCGPADDRTRCLAVDWLGGTFLVRRVGVV